MDDLISRQAAIGSAISGMTISIGGEKWIRVSEVRESLYSLPPARPEPKKGHWIEKEVMYIKDIKDAIDAWQSCKCSECGRYDTRPYMYFFVEPMFCSHCGAEMKRSE